MARFLGRLGESPRARMGVVLALWVMAVVVGFTVAQ